MIKRLTQLMSRMGTIIVSNHNYHHGPFTTVELEDSKGNKAWGMSRKSIHDEDRPDLGITIARGRAEEALRLKLMHRPFQHPYMG